MQEVREQYFSARLVDMTRSEKEETEESDLPIDDLVEGDRAVLSENSIGINSRHEAESSHSFYRCL